MIRTVLPKVQNAFPETCLKSTQSARPSYLWGRHKSCLWKLLNFCKMHWVFKGCSWQIPKQRCVFVSCRRKQFVPWERFVSFVFVSVYSDGTDHFHRLCSRPPCGNHGKAQNSKLASNSWPVTAVLAHRGSVLTGHIRKLTFGNGDNLPSETPWTWAARLVSHLALCGLWWNTLRTLPCSGLVGQHTRPSQLQPLGLSVPLQSSHCLRCWDRQFDG